MRIKARKDTYLPRFPEGNGGISAGIFHPLRPVDTIYK
jgi:hypothetical protein